MKRITLSDLTLLKGSKTLSFKEKIEIARCLDNLKIDVIYMPEIINKTTDSLLIKTISAFIKNSTLAVTVKDNVNDIETAYSAVKCATKKRISISLPVSPVQMEYVLHKKPAKMLELVKTLISTAKNTGVEVEFTVGDATRADKKFLKEVLEVAINEGASIITICDDEGIMLPDEFNLYIKNLIEEIPSLSNVQIGVLTKNTNNMATAVEALAIKAGASEIKGAFNVEDILSLEVFATLINNCGDRFNATSNINYVELHRITKQIKWILGSKEVAPTKNDNIESQTSMVFDSEDSIESIVDAVKKLGYDLSSEDQTRVYEEFKRVANKKTVTLKDLDAVVASVALQVPPIYKVISYVINNGNIITSSAHIKLEKEGKDFEGISTGDGPIDAAFRAIEQILGHKYELDDFQIQAVTEGKEAVGSAVVKLRSNGKLYSGNGISTDIIGASIRAYVSAVNKIVYEEANK